MSVCVVVGATSFVVVVKAIVHSRLDNSGTRRQQKGGPAAGQGAC